MNEHAKPRDTDTFEPIVKETVIVNKRGVLF